MAPVIKTLGVKISVPITNPKFVLAALAVAAPVPPFSTATAVPLHTPLVIVPTVAKFDNVVNVVLLPAVMFPAVAALPVIFPITFDPLTVLIFASDTAPSASLIVVIPPSATPPPELFAVT